jgi:hypothetical protein
MNLRVQWIGAAIFAHAIAALWARWGTRRFRTASAAANPSIMPGNAFAAAAGVTAYL